MKLTELHPQWIGAGGDGIYNADMTPAPLRHGIGLLFDCPKGCLSDIEDRGVERHYVSLANPLDGGAPFEANRSLWTRTGEDFETLTLTPRIHSVVEKGGCGWHGWITNGEVTGA